jgi:cleavage and polyadenylation specificity factor subunit 4
VRAWRVGEWVVKRVRLYGADLPCPRNPWTESAEDQCLQFTQGGCQRGRLCPYRHINGTKGLVCKHWLKGLCKNGDDCLFLHLYIEDMMPECYYFQQKGVCNKEDCRFKHLQGDDKRRDCAWYARGFCRNGMP